MSNLPSQTLTGVIIKRKLGKGKQKDEMVNAIFTKQGLDIVIRREGGTAFQDDLFDGLMGKTVVLAGVRQSFVLIVETVDVLENEPEEPIVLDMSQDFAIAK